MGDKHGGAEVQLYFIAKELAKMEDFEIFAFVGDFGQKKYETFEQIQSIRTFNPDASKIFKQLKEIFRYFIILFKQKPDLIITSGAGSLFFILTFYKKILKKKLIFRVSHIQDVNSSWGSNKLFKVLYRVSLKLTNTIVCQAEYQQKLLQTNYNLSSFLIPNFYKIGNYKMPEKKYVLYVSRCERWKRPELFIKLAGKMKNTSFKMICSPANDIVYFQQIKNEALKNENIHFVEKIEFKYIQQVFDEAAIFVNTSENEGFPNTFIQAGIAGVPLVSLSVNPDSFIIDYHCGFYCNGKFDQMNKYISELLSDNEKWNAMSKNIYGYVSKMHNLDLNFEKYRELITQILS